MSKAKSKTITKATKAVEPDAELIRACVQYAQATAAASAGFKADPDGDSSYAAPAADNRYRAASKALAFISAKRATTACGISAKARIAPMVLQNDSGGSPDQFASIESASVLFYRSFAEDVKLYMVEIISNEWAAAHAAKGGAI